MDMMGILGRYLDVLHPKTSKAAIAAEAMKDDARMTALHVLLTGLVGTLAALVYLTVTMATITQLYQSLDMPLPPEVVAVQRNSLTPIALAMNLVSTVLGFYVAIGALFGICKLLGGKGKLGNQLYVTSVVGLSASIVYGLLIMLTTVPFAACIAAPLLILFMLYMVYVAYLTIRAVHPNLDSLRAILAMVLYFVAMTVLLLVWSIVAKKMGL